MSLNKKIKILLAACSFAVTIWTLPALFGAGADQRPDDRRDSDQRPQDRRDAGRMVADVWRVEEGMNGQTTWAGTWTRRGRSNEFRGEWRNVQNGARVKDTLRLMESDGRIVFHRDGTNGEYIGQMSNDGAHMEGTATWYSSGGFWRADAARR